MIAFTERGICRLSFCDDVMSECQNIMAQWPKAQWQKDQSSAQALLSQVFAVEHTHKPLHLAVSGTNFQVNVWKALLKIPQGAVCSYQQIAQHIGKPSASRAVANAIGANPVAFLVPCHRVIRGAGEIGGYRWSPTRKHAILGWESAQVQPLEPALAAP